MPFFYVTSDIYVIFLCDISCLRHFLSGLLHFNFLLTHVIFETQSPLMHLRESIYFAVYSIFLFEKLPVFCYTTLLLSQLVTFADYVASFARKIRQNTTTTNHF